MAILNLFAAIRATDLHVFCALEHVELVDGQYQAVEADQTTSQACLISQGNASQGFNTRAAVSWPENNIKRLATLVKNGATSCGYFRLDTRDQSALMGGKLANEFFHEELPWFASALGCLIGRTELRGGALTAIRRIAELATNPNNVRTVLLVALKAGGRPEGDEETAQFTAVHESVSDVLAHIDQLCMDRGIDIRREGAIPIDPGLDGPIFLRRSSPTCGMLAW